jgi:hypothetical protein
MAVASSLISLHRSLVAAKHRRASSKPSAKIPNVRCLREIYAIQVQVYKVTLNIERTTRWGVIRQVLAWAVLYASIKLLFEHIWSTFRRNESFAWELVAAGVNGLVWAVLFYWIMRGLFHGLAAPTYEIHLSDESISRVSRFSRCTVKRAEIKTIVERNESVLWPAGLLVSERSRLGTYLWGGVWISRSLPEYEALRDTLFSWRSPN